MPGSQYHKSGAYGEDSQEMGYYPGKEEPMVYMRGAESKGYQETTGMSGNYDSQGQQVSARV